MLLAATVTAGIILATMTGGASASEDRVGADVGMPAEFYEWARENNMKGLAQLNLTPIDTPAATTERPAVDSPGGNSLNIPPRVQTPDTPVVAVVE